MIVNLFKWISVSTILPVWVITIIAILLWWLLSWLIMRLVLNWKIRRARVVILAHRVFFLVGAILIFNMTLVPIVLIAFHGMALYTLLICALAAFFYFIRVTDKEAQDMEEGYGFSSRSEEDDIFK